MTDECEGVNIESQTLKLTGNFHLDISQVPQSQDLGT